MCVYLIYNTISTFETLNVYKKTLHTTTFHVHEPSAILLVPTQDYMYYITVIQVHSTACNSSTCLYGVPLEAEPRLNFDL